MKYYNPVRVFQGADCLGELEGLLKSMRPQRKNILLLIRSNDVLKADNGKPIMDALRDKTVHIRAFADSEPDVGHLFRLYQDTADSEIDLVIAIGGGSVLDLGKSLCCLYGCRPSTKQELLERMESQTVSDPRCPWIGIPTTAGTGSEVTCWATLWDREANRKFSIGNSGNYAYAAFADPAYLASMPLSLAVSSALDAVAHATESYWAVGSNPVSKLYALAAIEELTAWLPRLMEDPQNPSVQDALSRGSLLAGLAFSNTRTTACHSISYPLTLLYRIPHGVAVSMLLAPVMRANAPVIADAHRFYKAFGETGAAGVGAMIHRLLKAAGIPGRLRDWGVRESEIDDLSTRCFTKGRMDNNPVSLTLASVATILQEIY